MTTLRSDETWARKPRQRGIPSRLASAAGLMACANRTDRRVDVVEAFVPAHRPKHGVTVLNASWQAPCGTGCEAPSQPWARYIGIGARHSSKQARQAITTVLKASGCNHVPKAVSASGRIHLPVR